MSKKIINYKFKKFNTYNQKEVLAVTKVVKSGVLSGFIASKKKGDGGRIFCRKI